MSYFSGVKWLAALGLGVAAVSAQAQGYAGALVQMSKYNSGGICESYGATDCDDKATGYKVYGGSVISESMGIEAAWIDFGKVKPRLGASQGEGRVKSIVLAAVLRADVYRGLVISGKAGLAATTATVSAGGEDDDEQHPAIYLGASIEYPIYKTLKVVGAFDFTRAQINGEKFGVSAFGLGAQVGF
jgi:OOP family OmpA-OmpF porin